MSEFSLSDAADDDLLEFDGKVRAGDLRRAFGSPAEPQSPSFANLAASIGELDRRIAAAIPALQRHEVEALFNVLDGPYRAVVARRQALYEQGRQGGS